jgi:polar amino acid transport system permease protein
MIHLIQQYGDALLGGLRVTLSLCVIVWTVGVGLGVALGSAAAKWRRAVGGLSRAAYMLAVGVPILVILFWLHYPLQRILGVVVPPFITAAAALTLVNAALVAELCRSAIVEFPKEYSLAGVVCGLKPREVALHIKLPILLRQLLPGVLLLQVNMLHATLFASLISVDELFRVVQRINSIEYLPIPAYTALAVFYLAISAPMHLLANRLAGRVGRSKSQTRLAA